MKSPGSTGEWQGKLAGLRQVGARGTLGGAVECVDIKRNAEGEISALGLLWFPAAIYRDWELSDAEARKRGERTGLDTPVVHAVNDVY